MSANIFHDRVTQYYEKYKRAAQNLAACEHIWSEDWNRVKQEVKKHNKLITGHEREEEERNKDKEEMKWK
jgi:hypothetical protein